MGKRLHTVKLILASDMYETVDLKEKIITKSQSKQICNEKSSVYAKDKYMLL